MPLSFFLMIRRPPRSTLDRSSAASDVYKRQNRESQSLEKYLQEIGKVDLLTPEEEVDLAQKIKAVSYTHLRAHETVLDLVCRLLLEKKKNIISNTVFDKKSLRNRSDTQ